MGTFVNQPRLCIDLISSDPHEEAMMLRNIGFPRTVVVLTLAALLLLGTGGILLAQTTVSTCSIQ